MTKHFDHASSQADKRYGMRLAEEAAVDLLEQARDIARRLARENGTVTADDVGRALGDNGSSSLGPAAGSLFRGREWTWTGQWAPSKRRTNHGRMLRVWRLGNA